MIAGLEKLVFYFEAVGTASVVAWVVAAALSLLFVAGLRRSKVCWTALILAVVGLSLAWINSANISEIEIDRTAEIEAAQQRAAELAKEEQEEIESGISEDSEEAKSEEAEEAATEDGEETAEEQDDVPAYRQAGVVEREGGMKNESLVPPVETVETETPVAKNVRMLTDSQFAEADRLDNMNLFCARWTLYVTLLLVAVDYFRRLNQTFDSLLPLPLSGPLVDSLFAKSHAEVAQGDAARWKNFLEQAVRKGETFIYFTGEDPWSQPYLNRLPAWTKIPWRLTKLNRPVDNELTDEFILESAWFGRYCFVLTGDGPQSVARMTALASFLELRHETRASARHTLNILWDHETPIPPELLDRILPLCGEANIRLVLSTKQPPSGELVARFIEA